MHAHFSGDVPQHNVTVFEFDSESRVWEILNDLALHLDGVVFCHY
jgi:hypothetical protein